LTNLNSGGFDEVMPRKLRLEFTDACYHVINRGNYRRDLFAGKGSAEAFERTLFETCARFGWRLHAYLTQREAGNGI
jgi:putative transposase